MSEIPTNRNPEEVVGLPQHEAQSGRDVNVGQAEQLPARIALDRDEIRPRNMPSGGTEIVVQRHGKYIRDKDDPNAGKSDTTGMPVA